MVRRFVFLTPFVLGLPLSAHAQVATEEAELLQMPNPSAGAGFGVTAALHGDTAVVGAQNPYGADEGGAFVYVRSGTTWSFQAELLGSQLAPYERFGSNFGLWGDTLLAGQPGETGSPVHGHVYVFARSGTSWSESGMLTAQDGAPSDAFGYSTGLHRDTGVVGASNVDVAGVANAGAVYVFVRSGTDWVEQAKLTASDGAASDVMGRSVAVSGDTVIGGALGHDVGAAVNAGAAYVFVRSGTSWSEQAKLTGSLVLDDRDFGAAVALSGETAVIGAPGGDAVYVFVRNGTTWSEQARLDQPPGPGSQFGVSVAIDGGTVVVGQRHGGAGLAHVYVRSGTTWPRVAEVTGIGLLFGTATAVWADRVLVGEPGANKGPPGSGHGRAAVFRLDLPFTSYCTAGASASGCVADVTGSGAPSATAASGFHLLATNIEGSMDGIFFYGVNGRQANSWGNGTSYQCVVPPVRRAGPLAGSGSSGQCDGSFSQDLNAHWTAKPFHRPGAGALAQAQLWYRDPQSTSNRTTSLSGAIEFAVGP